MEEINKRINEADASAKAKQKVYADHRRGATTPIFKVGDQVLVRQRTRNKLTSRFDYRPYKIVTTITSQETVHILNRSGGLCEKQIPRVILRVMSLMIPCVETRR